MDWIWTEAQKLIDQNDFLQGGLVLAVLGWIGYQLRTIPLKMQGLFIRYATTQVEFTEGNDEFDAMAYRMLSLHSNAESGNFLHRPTYEDVDENAPIVLVPAGSRWNRQHWCLINTIFAKRELESKAGSMNAVSFSLELTAYGFGRKKAIDTLIRNATSEFRRERRENLWVRYSSTDYWDAAGKLENRTFETVYSQHVPDIQRDLRQFLDSEKLYAQRGIPYRRGYLFSGPPGTGKTSLAKAMANFARRDLNVLQTATAGGLKSLFGGTNRLILIEDIDAAISSAHSRESSNDQVTGTSKAEESMGWTLAEILNAVDGVGSGHGNILIITTNYPERLDAALLRPGRVDRHYTLGHITKSEWEQLCMVYAGRSLPMPEDHLTAAEVQGVFIQCGQDPDQFAAFYEDLGGQ